MTSKSNHTNKSIEKLSRSSKVTIITQTITSIIFIALVSSFVFGDFQYNVYGTGLKISSVNCWVLSDTQRAYFSQQDTDASEKSKTLSELNEVRSKASGDENKINFKERTVVMDTNFGNISINLLDKIAPITTENFIRLTSRGKYDGLTFHRIVNQDNFNVIQGGDPKGDGTGGESAFGFKFKDEIIKPTSVSNSCKVDLAKNSTPNFVDPALYLSNPDSTVTYKKGLVAMANSGVNTNSSQFFIMLGDTKLPPNYTIFGKVDDTSLATLDKIKSEVKPADGKNDGKPDKEIKINKALLK
jgi:cyclophilin family peptidyl-prolyl cis-trans isomerase